MAQSNKNNPSQTTNAVATTNPGQFEFDTACFTGSLHKIFMIDNTCIDRGALQDTVIEDGVKLDNLIQIGHNVRVGKNTAMAGCVGVAGSATIGANCTIGGGAIVLGHLVLADGVNISAATVVTRSIRKAGHYTGIFPIDDNAVWEKNAASLKQLHGLRDRIRSLEGNTKK